MNNLWVQTDDATGQHVQAIAGESGAYRFIDTIGLGKSQYAVITDEARVSGQDLQDSEFIHEYLHPYGYETLLGMSRSTLWSKIRDPREFRLGELLLLYDVLHFSDEDRRILL